MSLGYAGAAHLVEGDGRSALYTYKCENWNNPDDNPREDGEIYVELEPIASAYVPRRTKRYPDGVPIHSAERINLGELLERGAVQIRNCSSTTQISPLGIDVQTIPLFRKIALAIQLTGEFPAEVSYAK